MNLPLRFPELEVVHQVNNSGNRPAQSRENPAVFYRQFIPIYFPVSATGIQAPDDKPGGIPQLVGKVAAGFKFRRSYFYIVTR